MPQFFAELDTAKDWGLTPFKFFELSEGERIIMIAFSNVSAMMEAWEIQESKPGLDTPPDEDSENG